MSEDKEASVNLALWMSKLLDRKGGLQITILDLRGISTITDMMVIATGTSSRHIQTLVEAPCLELKKNGFPAQHIEGQGTHWVVADFSDVLLHVFDEQARKYFDLEGLWSSAPRIEWNTRGQNPLQVLSV